MIKHLARSLYKMLPGKRWAFYWLRSMIRTLKMNWHRIITRGIHGVVNVLKHSALRVRKEEQSIFLEVNEPINIKTLRELLILFELSDYQVFLHVRPNRRLVAIGNLFEWHHNLALIWQLPSQVPILCTDSQSVDRACDKVIYLRYDYTPLLKLCSGHFPMPIPMHPQIYVQYRAHKKLNYYRQTPRKIRILFSGNWDSHGYDNLILKELFGKLTRYEILRFLQQEKLVHIVSDHQELKEILSGTYCNRFILLSQNARVNQAEWLKIVAHADFFLCPPGVLFPWSHNAVEAMAVGTIPLINYPEWFFPNLVNGINCVTFSTLNELVNAIEHIRKMDEEHIATLRAQVIEYYAHYLDPQGFIEKLIQYPAEEVYLHLRDRRESVLRQAMMR